jgi:hypothetical protein
MLLMISYPWSGLGSEVINGSLCLCFWVRFTVYDESGAWVISLLPISVHDQGVSGAFVGPYAVHLVTIESVKIVINVYQIN